MYAPALVARAQSRLEKVYREALPNGLIRYPVDVCTAMTRQLASAVDPAGTPQRQLTPAEDAFLANERLLTKIDFRYWAERYAHIRGENGLQPICPFWEPQEILLGRIAALELQRVEERHPDGLLINVLKARQEGVSTISQALVAHRLTTQTHVNGITASDVPENSGSEGIFGKFELLVEHLPWFLRPATKFHKKDTHWVFANGSWMTVESGKSMKGGLQDEGGTKGNLGRSKSQPLDAGILTPTGWRPMGDLALGDLVIGRNGVPTPVTGIYPQGDQPTYRIWGADGATTECSGDHLWTVEWRERSDEPVRTLTCHTTELLAAGLQAHKNIWRFRLPLPAPVQFFAAPLSLDPYLVGVLIGDGVLSAGRAGFTSADPQLATRVATRLPDGHRLATTRQLGRTNNYFIVAEQRGRPNRVVRALRSLGLYGKRAEHKAIPVAYLHATPADRVRLLQGLLDTDGWIGKDGRIGYCTVSHTLAAGVAFVIRSLGGTAKISTHQPYYTYKGVRKAGQLAYRIAVVLPTEIEPFWLARKLDRYYAVGTRRVPTRAIVKIEYVGLRPSQCIRVAAADHLYVTDDFVVTHNTFTVGHLTELSTWERPEQIDDGLLPAVPRSPRTLVLKESTAKGRHNWHHEDWLDAVRGQGHGAVGGRFIAVFLPWYALAKHWLPAPIDWVPDANTLAHAQKAARDGPTWMGHAVTLSRPQLYWYESMRTEYLRKPAGLAKFLEEYAADPEECFQHSGRSIFGHEQLQYLDQLAKPMIDCWTVNVARDLSDIRANDLAQIRLAKSLAATLESAPSIPDVELSRG